MQIKTPIKGYVHEIQDSELEHNHLRTNHDASSVQENLISEDRPNAEQPIISNRRSPRLARELSPDEVPVPMSCSDLGKPDNEKCKNCANCLILKKKCALLLKRKVIVTPSKETKESESKKRGGLWTCNKLGKPG